MNTFFENLKYIHPIVMTYTEDIQAGMSVDDPDPVIVESHSLFQVLSVSIPDFNILSSEADIY